jgi:hypothetical protein
MQLNVQLQIRRSTLKQIVRSVLRLLGCIFWLVCPENQLTGPYIFPQLLTGGIYDNFLQDELPVLLENLPLQTRRQMYYQHDGVLPHFSHVVRQYLNHKFPNRWIGCGGAQNWPQQSPDLNPLDYLT